MLIFIQLSDFLKDRLAGYIFREYGLLHFHLHAAALLFSASLIRQIRRIFAHTQNMQRRNDSTLLQPSDGIGGSFIDKGCCFLS